MEYKCIICNYSTNVKFAYQKHTTSKRHIKKVEESNTIPTEGTIRNQKEPKGTLKYGNNKKSNKSFICKFCDKNYSTSGSLARHRKICSNNKAIKDTKYKDLENFHLKEVIRILERNTEKLEEDTIYYKKLIDGAGILANKSMSTLSYILKNYPNAPKLSKLEDYSYLEQNDTDGSFDLLEMVFTHNKHGTLHKYLGNFIVNAYTKINPNEQSIWNSDSTRLTYIIRDLLDTSLDWRVDKKGILTKCQIIDPLLVYLQNLLSKCLDDNDLINHSNDSVYRMKQRI